MKQILQITVFLFLAIIFSGCGSARINLSKKDVLENDYVSFNPPNDDYEGYKKGKKNFDYKNTIYLENYTPRLAQYDITVHTFPERNPKYMTFDKNADYEKISLEYYNSQKVQKNQRERGIVYAKSEVQYIKGMKCDAQVESQGVPMAIDSGVIKKYDIFCGYYDKEEKANDGRRLLFINYWFKYFPGNVRLEKDKNTPLHQAKSRDEYELDLKEQVKALIDSMVIKNFDVERMIKEGLYHPDKKYEHMKH